MKNQKRKAYFLLPALAVAVLFLAGCGKSVSQKASEKTAEKIIEAQTGGKADVDINDKNVKVETAQGTMETGESVKLPADFPKDVYVIEGTIKVAFSDNESRAQTISIETGKSVEEAATAYQEKLKADGWQITGTMNFGDSASVMGEKDSRIVTVAASKSDNKTVVNINVGKK